jgi:hypothetical protein
MAYDGSTDSNKALEMAVAMAVKLRSRVLVLVLAPVCDQLTVPV